MAKTNFTKVEEALVEGLRKMQVKELLELADTAAGMGTEKDLTAEKRRLGALALGHAFKWLGKKDPKILKRLKVTKQEVEHFLKSEESITDTEWERIQQLKKEIEAIKKELFPGETDEELVEEQREKHKKKRFNISEKWLPLD